MYTRRLTDWIIHICLFIIAAGVLTSAFWLLYPYDVITFYKPEFRLNKTQYYPGEGITWDVDVYQHTTGVQVDLNRQLVNSVIINFSPSGYVTKEGRQTFTNASLDIPQFAPPGMYRLVIYSIFHVNPLRTVTITRTSDMFEVLSSPKDTPRWK